MLTRTSSCDRRELGESWIPADPRQESTILAQNADKAWAQDEDGGERHTSEIEEGGAAPKQWAATGAAGFDALRAAIASLSGDLARSCQLVESSQVENGSQWVEINALCFTGGPQLGEVLVLVPAAAGQVDLRWLALVLRWPRRKLRLASEDECIDDFGAVPGRVPPIPLKPGIRVLCDPRLRDVNEAWGSSCDLQYKLLIRDPAATLPALVQAATEAASSEITRGANGSDGPPNLMWFPPRAHWYPTLDDALDVMSVKASSAVTPSHPKPDASTAADEHVEPGCGDSTSDDEEASDNDPFAGYCGGCRRRCSGRTTTAAGGSAAGPLWRPPAYVKLT